MPLPSLAPRKSQDLPGLHVIPRKSIPRGGDLEAIAMSMVVWEHYYFTLSGSESASDRRDRAVPVAPSWWLKLKLRIQTRTRMPPQSWPGRLRKCTNLLLNIHFAITNSILRIRYSKYPLILTFVWSDSWNDNSLTIPCSLIHSTGLVQLAMMRCVARYVTDTHHPPSPR